VRVLVIEDEPSLRGALVELHRQIHDWFARGEVGTLEDLDARVYADLFLTPNDDPWLGLRPPSVFTAIAEE
jgi:hypothetical protein